MMNEKFNLFQEKYDFLKGSNGLSAEYEYKNNGEWHLIYSMYKAEEAINLFCGFYGAFSKNKKYVEMQKQLVKFKNEANAILNN